MAKVTIRTEWLDRIADEPIEVQNEVCGAIFLYQCGREVAGLSEAGQRAFAYLRRFVDKELEHKAQVSQNNRRSAQARWAAPKPEAAQNDEVQASGDANASENICSENTNKSEEMCNANASKSMRTHKKTCERIKNNANASDERERGSLSSSSSLSSPTTSSFSILPPITLQRETPTVWAHPRMCEGAGECEPETESQTLTAPDDEQLDIFSGLAEEDLPEEIHDLVRQLWNRECKSFSKIVAMNAERRNKTLVRAREIAAAYGTADVLSSFAELFRRMEASSFLKGDNERGWKATFDWFVANGNNWVKVSEGTYDNRQMAQGGHQKTDPRLNVNKAWEGIAPLSLK